MRVHKKVVFRDSKNGQFVSPKTAKRRPATTEREVRDIPQRQGYARKSR